MDRYEGKSNENPKKVHSVAVQANATDSVFELYAHREEEKNDFQCQWPCGEAPACRQILSPAHIAESFFVCGEDSLGILLQDTACGCTCGSPYIYDGALKHMDGHVLRLEFFMQERPQDKVV
ncbi:hypothetical protein OS493_040411 [Desmophyllum pertusum]|uniref:Uncharacterized protein n=1 Tax=Desmophyllum pertusum TaxID=174260 RepID=A0A9W9Y6H0_9CNID|nr:hypothetical protein OS493_040411 [Desmophyllum pertusum]